MEIPVIMKQNITHGHYVIIFFLKTFSHPKMHPPGLVSDIQANKKSSIDKIAPISLLVRDTIVSPSPGTLEIPINPPY